MKLINLIHVAVAISAGMFVKPGRAQADPVPPVITNQPASQIILNGQMATFNVGVAGTGPYSYQWQLNGTNLPYGIISTVAGNGTLDYFGDGGVATNARLNMPNGVAVDAAGNLFMADRNNNRVRKVDASGIITTVAGNGNFGYIEDGVAATTTSLASPSGVAVDAAGNLFIADQSNQRIRKVDTNGIITTVAGDGGYSYTGDGVAATNTSLRYPRGLMVDPVGNLFIADTENQRIRKVDTNGIISTVAGTAGYYFSGDGGPATNAVLNYPSGVTMDASGNLYIADSYNNRIRKVETNGIITTFAGNGTAGIYGNGGPATNSAVVNPTGVAWDASGSLFIAEQNDNRIRRVDPNGVITTVAGNGYYMYNGDGGPADQAGLNNPAGVAVDAYDNLFIADMSNERIRKVTPNGPVLNVYNVNTTNAGNYQVIVTSASGSVTSSVVVLTVAYPPVITSQPVNLTVIGTNGNGAAFSVAVTGTEPLAYQWQFNGTNLADAGNISGSATNSLILNQVTGGNSGNYQVVITNAWGSVTSRVAVLNVLLPPVLVLQPASQGVLNGSNTTFNVSVTGSGPFSYQWRLNGTNLPNGVFSTVAGKGIGTYSGDGGAATNAGIFLPSGVALDAGGNLFIADMNNNRIRMVTPNGIISTVAGNGIIGYSGNGVAATNSSLNRPAGVAVDSKGNLFIADTSNQRIRMVTPSGVMITVAGNGNSGYSGDGGAATNASLTSPTGVAVDAQGNLYIADEFNRRIRKVSTGGIITTVAGTGIFGYGGDGGPATNALLANPKGVTLDASGNLLIADMANQRLRKVDTNGIITTVAGNGSSGFFGDGGAATNAFFNQPSGVAVDAQGNVFIADAGNQRIRKLTVDGIVATVANNSLYYPAGVAVDGFGNVIIADQNNSFIRKLTQQGPLLPVMNVNVTNAGNYQVVITNAYGSVTSSVAILTDLLPPAISKQPASQSIVSGHSATNNVSATGSAPLHYQWQFNGTNLVDIVHQGGTNSPTGSTTTNLILNPVTVTNGGSYTVIITNAYGSVTSGVATLTITFPPAITNQPVNLLVTNNLPVALNVGVTGTGPFTYQWLYNGKLLPVNTITTLAGNGNFFYSGNGVPAINATLNRPGGVAVDDDGNVYIADTSDSRIRKVGTNGIITTVAGNGNIGFSGNGNVATNSSLSSPAGVAVDGFGEVYIADTSNQRIRVETYGFLITVAGNGNGGYFGDGGPAYNAFLNRPASVAVDANGNLFIADVNNLRIRKVDLNDNITTYAGNGTFGFSGDGGPATNASLGNPSGVAVDANGNLYIADSSNQRIRKVDVNGIITTVAGKNSSGYSGDGILATNATLNSPNGVAVDIYGNLYIADTFNQRIRKVDASGIISTVAGRNGSGFFGDGGAATNASLNQPNSVAVDAAGDLYIADSNNSRIRKVTPQGPALTFPIANPTNGGTYQVIVSSASGSVTSSVVTLTVQQPPYIILQPTNQSIVNGRPATLYGTAGGNPTLTYQWRFNGTNLPGRTSTSLSISPVSVANVGPYQLVVANQYGSVTSSPAILTITYPPVITQQPQSVTVSRGDTASLSVGLTGGTPFYYQWYFNGAPLAGQNAANLSFTGVNPTAAGNYYVLITNLYGKATSSTALVTVTGPPVITVQPVGGAVFAGGSTMLNGAAVGVGPLHYQWLLNGTTVPGLSNVIITLAGNGTSSYTGDGGAALIGGLNRPFALAQDGLGDLLFSDSLNIAIRQVDTNGLLATVFANSGMANTFGLAVDAAGNRYFSDSPNHVVHKLDLAGNFTIVAGNGTATYAGDGGPATNASLNYPIGVKVDQSGNLYIADYLNSVIRKVDTNGIITTVAGNAVTSYSGDGGAATNASLYLPYDLAVDAAGNLYIADTGNSAIRKVDMNGTIRTVAGQGFAGYTGDGGNATNATLNSPEGLFLDATGNLIIVDSLNNVIRKLDTNNIISTIAGNGTYGYSGDGGTATNANFANPVGVTMDPAGDLFIADTLNNVIREVMPTGGSPTLPLNNVNVGNAGNYQLVITNAYGSVTSSVVNLTVSGVPLISVASNNLSGITLNLLTAPNTSSQILAATNLTPPIVWQSLGANTPGANGAWQFTDPNASQYPVRFYRTSTP